MLAIIYHMTLKLHFLGEKVKMFSSFTQRYDGRHYVCYEIFEPLVVYRLYCIEDIYFF